MISPISHIKIKTKNYVYLEKFLSPKNFVEEIPNTIKQYFNKISSNEANF